MNKTFLLAAASAIALCAAGGSPCVAAKLLKSAKFNSPPSNVLWNQNSNSAGYYLDSQNFTSGSSQYNDQGADDFVVPTGVHWRITEVDVTAEYEDGSGPATSENVIFYKNKNGMPGAPVTNGTFTDLNGTGGPNFAIVLPGRGIRLKPGRYWVSVIANMDFYSGGLWAWGESSVENGKLAMWQNPGRGWGICPTWNPIENCQGGASGPDFMFELKGKSR